MSSKPTTSWTNAQISQFLRTDLANIEHELADEETIVENVQFQGFDPVVVAKEAIRLYAENASDTQGNVLNGVKAVCIVCATRGFDWVKMKLKLSDVGVQYINSLIKVFKLDIVARNSVIPPKTITPQRLCAAFPLMYLSSFAKYGKALSLGPHKIKKGFMTPLAGIFIANEEYDLWLQWAKEYHFIVNKGNMSNWPKSLTILNVQRQTLSNYSTEVVNQINKVLGSSQINITFTTSVVQDVPTTKALEMAINALTPTK